MCSSSDKWLTYNDPLHSLVGLCALSVNHSNSYLAYPGSATIGEITLYDANNLVSLHSTPDVATKWEKKNCSSCDVSWEPNMGTGSPVQMSSESTCLPPLEHSNADPSSRQSPSSPRLQRIRYETGECFGEGEERLLFFFSSLLASLTFTGIWKRSPL